MKNNVKKLILVGAVGIVWIIIAGADVYLTISADNKLKVMTVNEKREEEEENYQEGNAEDVKVEYQTTFSGFNAKSVMDGNSIEAVQNKNEENDGKKNDSEKSDYILPDSDSKYYSVKDLKGMTKKVADTELNKYEIANRDMIVKNDFIWRSKSEFRTLGNCGKTCCWTCCECTF